MKRYCVDTSGFSTPLERMPDDIYQPIWDRVIDVLATGAVAVNDEIYTEMQGSLRGVVGTFIDTHHNLLVLEIGDDAWDWRSYTATVGSMQQRHHDFISEYNQNRRGTVGLNDISIVALAKAIGVPLVSMEVKSGPDSKNKRKIPNVCLLEGVEHLQFNDFLRREGISLRQT
jgi:hypothetical protein